MSETTLFDSAQSAPPVDVPTEDDIYRVGTLATILQLLKLPDGTVKVLVEGQARVKITEFLENDNFFEARAEYLSEMPGDITTTRRSQENVTFGWIFDGVRLHEDLLLGTRL